MSEFLIYQTEDGKTYVALLNMAGMTGGMPEAIAKEIHGAKHHGVITGQNRKVAGNPITFNSLSFSSEGKMIMAGHKVNGLLSMLKVWEKTPPLNGAALIMGKK